MGWLVYKNGFIDTEINITPHDDGTADIDFPKNTGGTPITYVVEYKVGTSCGRMQISQPAGCYTPTGCEGLTLTATTHDGTSSTTNVTVPSAGGESNYVIISHSTVPEPPPTPPTGYGTINVNLTNNTGSEIRLYGESIMNISTTPSAGGTYDNVTSVDVHLVSTHSHGWEDETNTIVIPAGGTKKWSYNVENKYLTGTYGIVEYDYNYGVPLLLYAMYYTTSSNKVKKGNGFYHTKVNGHQYLTDGATINVEADYLGVAGNVGKIILADENTRISTIPSDKTYVILLPNQTTLPA